MAKKSHQRTSDAVPTEGKSLSEGKDLPEGVDVPEGQALPEGDDFGVRRFVSRSVVAANVPFSGATGDDVLKLARKHLAEPYVLGARAPMANAGWTGPWDCAEFASWCVYQASKVLFGTEPRSDPILADAYTGYWWQQAQASAGSMIDWRDAAAIPGAAVLRRPVSGQIGHIVISDGRGGTVEAHSRRRGVIADTLSDRRWDCGILVPGIRYGRADVPVKLSTVAVDTLRLTSPLTQGDRVKAVQQRLVELTLMVGRVDGIYGPQTAHAVRRFQAHQGLVADGEVGRATLDALGLGANF